MIFNNQFLQQYVRTSKNPYLLSSAKKIQNLVALYQKSGLGIVRRVPYDNIFHCCVQKTASQWFRSVFNDFIFYQYSGLPAHCTKFPRHYSKIELPQDYDKTLPRKRVATPLYINYSDYLNIPKPEQYKTFFVTRDPRDIVVSFYFSTKYSHPSMVHIIKMRRELQTLNMQEGLKYATVALQKMGVFEAQKSWINTADHNHKIFRFEDLANNNYTFLRQLLSYLDVEIPANKFDTLYHKHSFEHHAQGRTQGEEDINSHYRRGTPGDWENYFDRYVMNHFKDTTTNLVEILGYAEEAIYK